ncbi:MAG: hypothetical protein BGO41_08040 [Clostridiales bacterium 38-18]|nr:MAG: hypothetical protein BGO41_08040 [Clostridiales bacterium 38-18]
MNWEIIVNSDYKDTVAETGNKLLIGNGYLGVRGTLDEHEKEELVAITLAGIYDKVGNGWREPLNAPNPFWSKIHLDDQLLTARSENVIFHEQNLQFRYGILIRETVWKTEKGNITLKTERYADINAVNKLHYRISLSSDQVMHLRLSTGINSDVWDIHGPHYKGVRLIEKDSCLACEALVQNDIDRVAVVREDTIAESSIYEKRLVTDESKIFNCYEIELNPHQSFELTSEIAIVTTKDHSDALNKAIQVCQSSSSSDKTNHLSKWDKIWNTCEVEIGGDEMAEMGMNYSLYQLNIAAPRHSKSLSIPARALSGQVYKGAIFWDTEMFMLDYFLWTQPEIAKTLIGYRIDTLSGALEKASQYGYEGAFYAWESQEGGFDACSDYNVTDVFTNRPVRTYFKDKQMHISSAIARGIDYYVQVTDDFSVLLEGGLITVIECAMFYRSLLLKPLLKDHFVINDVIGPDEYHERVNNNAYTNYMAHYTIKCAIEQAKAVMTLYPEAYLAIDKVNDISEKLKKLEAVVDKIYLPKPNEFGLLEQFDGYFTLEDITPDIAKSRLKHPKEYWGGGNGVASDTQVIKQADVLTLMEVRSDIFSPDVIEKNWHYYEPRTEHGSSLSACMYALTACRFNRPDLSYPFFLKSALSDLKGGGKQWAGLVYIGGTHPAASGGAWKSLIQGFAGLELSENEPLLSPNLPEHWQYLVFRINYKGKLIKIRINSVKGSYHILREEIK